MGRACRRPATPFAIPYPNIEALLDDGGDISLGPLASFPCVATASTADNALVMLIRRDDESLMAMLRRLERGIGKALAEPGLTIDEINGCAAVSPQQLAAVNG